MNSIGSVKLPAIALCTVALLTIISSAGCEKRIVRKEERPFTDYCEKNWKKLTPRQKADYYEMLERQKERAKKHRRD